MALHRQLYTQRHVAAAETMIGWVSDDVFTDWRSWVVAQGRATFDAAVGDPDSLADVVDWSGLREGAGELIGAAAAAQWYDRYPEGVDAGGRELAIVELDGEPTGDPIPETARAELFPRLFARRDELRPPLLLRVMGWLLRRRER